MSQDQVGEAQLLQLLATGRQSKRKPPSKLFPGSPDHPQDGPVLASRTLQSSPPGPSSWGQGTLAAQPSSQGGWVDFSLEAGVAPRMCTSSPSPKCRVGLGSAFSMPKYSDNNSKELEKFHLEPDLSSLYEGVHVKICVCVCAHWSPTLYMGCGPPGSSVHGIVQTRILEWVAIYSSKGSSQPRDRTRVSCVSCIGRQISLPLSHLGSPQDRQ